MKKKQLKGIKILLVEDDDFLAEILKASLGDDGGVVLVTESAKEAFTIAQKERPDVIITDLMLSGMSGEELLREIKRDELLKETPVIVFTNKGLEPEAGEKILQDAAEYHVKSSTNLSEIPDIIERVLSKKL